MNELGGREDGDPGALPTLQQVLVGRHQRNPGSIRERREFAVSRIRDVVEFLRVCLALEPILFAEERREATQALELRR